MQPNVKIATCCYCSARTMLKPTARDGHELACGSCGAPLHEMKWLKAPAAAPKPVLSSKSRKPAKLSKPTKQAFLNWQAPPKKAKKRKPKKRRKSIFADLLEEAWDFAEDIFD